MQNEAQGKRDAALEKSRESGDCRDKVRGCLIGGAAGDALGYPVEFMGEMQILTRFGEDGITEYQLSPRTGKALISDDTQMTLFTATGCLAASAQGALSGVEKATYAYVKTHYEDWYWTQVKSFAERKADLEAMTEEERSAHSWLAGEPRLYSRRAPGTTCMGALRRQLGQIPFEPANHPANDPKGCSPSATTALESNELPHAAPKTTSASVQGKWGLDRNCGRRQNESTRENFSESAVDHAGSGALLRMLRMASRSGQQGEEP